MELFIDLLGYVGGLLLGWCGVPQSLAALKNGHTKGLERQFLWMWFSGEIVMVVVTLYKFGLVPFLMLNYALNLIMLSPLMYYTYFPRREP